MFNVDNAENPDERTKNRANKKSEKMIVSGLDERRIIVTAEPMSWCIHQAATIN